MYLFCLLVITSVHWTQEHLQFPVNYCDLAKVCVHDNRMVCATTENNCIRRTFLDQCDMYEYNCDYRADYRQTYTQNCYETSLVHPIANYLITTIDAVMPTISTKTTSNTYPTVTTISRVTTYPRTVTNHFSNINTLPTTISRAHTSAPATTTTTLTPTTITRPTTTKELTTHYGDPTTSNGSINTPANRTSMSTINDPTKLPHIVTSLKEIESELDNIIDPLIVKTLKNESSKTVIKPLTNKVTLKYSTLCEKCGRPSTWFTRLKKTKRGKYHGYRY